MRVTSQQAIDLLNTGQVVALPTETVYGLAAKLSDRVAIDAIFKIKGRPANNPLIIHLSDISQVHDYLLEGYPQSFERLAQTFWPGPLTLVVPIHPPSIPYSVRAGLPTAAFRIPNNPFTLEVIRETGPLVMPSANLSGRPSSTLPHHVESDFGEVFPVLDGGKCQSGLESTILIFQKPCWRIIRSGALTPEDLVKVLNYYPDIDQSQGDTPLCPGQLYKHYSPKAKLHLCNSFTQEFKGVIVGFSDREYPLSNRVISWGLTSSPEQVANHLYAILRQLDEESIAVAYIDIDFPSEGLWNTILERLTKAAHQS